VTLSTNGTLLGVQAIAHNADGEVLMAGRARGFGKGTWGLPGGQSGRLMGVAAVEVACEVAGHTRPAGRHRYVQGSEPAGHIDCHRPCLDAP
jgi:hypothetical protein